MNDLPFAKGQAAGNDYLVVDAADLDRPITIELVRALCDRHFGIGADGVLVAELGGRTTTGAGGAGAATGPAAHAGGAPARGVAGAAAEPVTFGLRIYNPDGTEAEKSGNGLRIFGAYLHGLDRVGGESFRVRLARDTVRMRVVAEEPGGALRLEVDMGRASFRGEDVGFAPEPGVALGHELELGNDLVARVNPVSMGNPHCVVFVDALDRDDFLVRAPRLATHPAFRAGTNVQFATVRGPNALDAWIWERGVGETLASGSSACAVAAAAVRLGLVEGPGITVHMRGDRLRVEMLEAGEVRLEGPAQIVFRGEVPRAVAAAWDRPSAGATRSDRPPPLG